MQEHHPVWCAKQFSATKPPRTTNANLDCVLVKKTFYALILDCRKQTEKNCDHTFLDSSTTTSNNNKWNVNPAYVQKPNVEKDCDTFSRNEVNSSSSENPQKSMYSSQCQNSKEEASSKEEEVRLSPSVKADMEEAVIEGQVREVLRGGKFWNKEKKCVFNKRTVKVCISFSWWCPGTLAPSAEHLTVSLFV